MATEQQETPVFEPMILHVKTDYRPSRTGDHWDFTYYDREAPYPSVDDIFIKQLGFYSEASMREPSSGFNYSKIRYVAAHRDGKWAVARASAFRRDGRYYVHLFDVDERAVDKIAFPVDPRIKSIDIEGATGIYKNKAGTAWLFSHASAEDHHARLLLAEATITTVFEQELTDLNDNILIAMFHNKPRNQILGKMTVYTHVKDFKNDCAKIARYNESQLYLGQHIHEPEKYDLYSMCEKALSVTKQKWTREKAQELNAISDYVGRIEKRLSSRLTYKTRWEADVFNSVRSAQASDSNEG